MDDTLCASDIVCHGREPQVNANALRDTQCHWHKVCHGPSLAERPQPQPLAHVLDAHGAHGVEDSDDGDAYVAKDSEPHVGQADGA